MGSFLRSIVASPRVRNDDKGTGTSLDMAYITDSIIVMSLPAPSFPETAYRNPLGQVLTFLDTYHSGKWRIFEFRGEGAGYRDAAFRNNVEHYPWPDHHPPPFDLVPLIVDSMHQHITAAKSNVAVLHCKAGKGRSGSMSCAYLIVHQGWTSEDAMKHFTAKRMRIGEGISIPSQQRWLRYVEKWATDQRVYKDLQLEILELQVRGLRENVHIRIVQHDKDNKNRKLVIRHTFTRSEEKLDGASTIYRPSKTLLTGCNVERRVAKNGFVLAVAHSWFNAYFEGGSTGGEYHVEWAAMDGIAGTRISGVKALDSITIRWRVVDQSYGAVPIVQ